MPTSSADLRYPRRVEALLSAAAEVLRLTCYAVRHRGPVEDGRRRDRGGVTANREPTNNVPAAGNPRPST
jgi:hypothetical protein